MTASSLNAANELIEHSLVWDNHSCMPLRPGDQSFLPQLERLRTAGVNAVTLNVGMDINSPESHFAMLDSFHEWVESHGDNYLLADGVDAIESARRSGRIAVFFDVEGMKLLDDGDLSKIEVLRRRGVIWMLVAYNRNNRAGGGCLDEDPGLSLHGKAILDEMRRVGMVACCSHSGHRTAMEVMEAVENPVIFSHSNPSAVYPHVRNIPDQLIKACAETGGVVGINGVGDFLGEGENYSELIARHVDYVVELVGPDHVGIALDYVFDRQEVWDYIEKMRDAFGEEMASQFSDRFAPPETFGPLVARLLELGYPAESIEKIVGGNWARVVRTVSLNAPGA